MSTILSILLSGHLDCLHLRILLGASAYLVLDVEMQGRSLFWCDVPICLIES